MNIRFLHSYTTFDGKVLSTYDTTDPNNIFEVNPKAPKLPIAAPRMINPPPDSQEARAAVAKTQP